MHIAIRDILRNEIFSNAEILGGKRGLNREVKQISVFDCPCVPDIIEKKTLNKGDLFITCLEQFRDDDEGKEIRFYFQCLIQSGCAGLLIVTEDRTDLLTGEILELCEKSQFPVIVIPEDYPYALIINTVNGYLSFDTFNTINQLKLEKIMYENISDTEKAEVLYSIKPTVKKQVMAIFVCGKFNSDIAKLELQNYYMSRENHIFVRTEGGMRILLSEEEEHRLNDTLNTCIVRIREFMDDPVIGYSRVFPRKHAGKALEEAKHALETAEAMHMTVKTYDALSSIQLLMAVKDSQEAEDYYDEYLEALRRKIAPENLREMILTIENYVANSGNFKLTAKQMNQHENTIRYRVNRVKCALDMESDTIKFNETIALAAKLRLLLNRKL